MLNRRTEIGKRLDEIGLRCLELGTEAPRLAQSMDLAVRSNDRATAMLIQIVLESRLEEARVLREELAELRKELEEI